MQIANTQSKHAKWKCLFQISSEAFSPYDFMTRRMK
jgi:hypothetical protein